jgi:hypothetical protein
MAAAAAAAVALLVLAFPEGGTEPYKLGSLVNATCLAAVLVVLAPRSHRALRVAAAAYAAACALSYAIPSALGGNVVRHAMTFGGALLLLAVWPRSRVVAVAVACLALAWQWQASVKAIDWSHGDPSAHAAYFAPLVAYMDRRGEPSRLEIPFTRGHWETAYVAPHAPLARGWERQLDLRYNALFYRPGLTAEAYHRWLLRSGVGYVALADAPLDSSAIEEAAIIAQRPPFLRPAASFAHWRIWQVTDARPLAEGPVRAERARATELRLRFARPGVALVRVHYTHLWAVEDGAGCARPGPGGWTIVEARRAGPVRLAIESTRLLDGDGCSAAG